MSINIQRNQKKRVVIVGGGLGGLRLAEDLYGSGMQVVLIDKNNFHQFPSPREARQDTECSLNVPSV